MGLVVATARDECPMCGAHAKETATHHLLECSAFAQERRHFLFPLLGAAGSDDPAERLRSLLLLRGFRGGRVVGWARLASFLQACRLRRVMRLDAIRRGGEANSD
jgi:hypothetical protein